MKTEILRTAENVKRHSLRVKNSGNHLLYTNGMKILNKIKQSNNLSKVLELEEAYFKMIKEEYASQVTGISTNHNVKNMADGYGPGDPQIDSDFISEVEGGQQNGGYVPEDDGGNPLDKSGVTVGTGVDIGQMSEDEINNLNISQDLKDKLIDYAGLSGQDAVDALKENPLTITDAEADQLDNAVKENATNSLVDAFNDGSTGVNFLELPPEMQTAIASVAYQYGDLETACPKFWKDITENRWEDAENELRNFGDNYPTRRDKEADLFHEGIQKLNKGNPLP